MDDIEYYNATDLRTSLLYSGQIVLKSYLRKTFYNYFLLLVFAIRLGNLFKQFVNDYGNLYEHYFISYNVHSLI